MRESTAEVQSRLVDFLPGFVADLNKLAEVGWALLVEGQRDAKAVKDLGYLGPILTISALARGRMRSLGSPAGIVILTDFDREGRQLAARYARILNHEGIQTTLSERKRLLIASSGIFRQIENLSRFVEPASV